MTTNETTAVDTARSGASLAMQIVRNQLEARATFGPKAYSKTEVRNTLERARGAVGLFTMICGEATGPFAPVLSTELGREFQALAQRVRDELR